MPKKQITEKQQTKNENNRKNLDTPWKRVIKAFLNPFFEFLLPHAAKEIDWSKPPKFLDKELLELEKDAAVGNKIADILVQVTRKNGKPAWVVIHIEIQGAYEKLFEQRMFHYYYRAAANHNMQVMSMAILAGSEKDWNPNEYHQALWGCELRLTYPVIRLIDFKDKLSDLEKSANPIAKVIEAHLLALQAKSDAKLGLQYQTKLVKNLLHLGYTKGNIRDLYQFIDYRFNLPETLNRKFIRDLQEYEKEVNMQRYVTSMERIGRQDALAEGLAIGEVKGEVRLLMRQLRAKFKRIPKSYVTKINTADADTLERWSVNFVFADTLADVFKDV